MANYFTGGTLYTSVAPGKTVTATNLNAHVAAAKILPLFMDEHTHDPPAVGLDDVVLTADAAFTAWNMPTLEDLFAAIPSDTAANVASLRTIAIGALATGQQAAPGNILSLSNSFTGALQTFKHIASAGGASILAAAAGLGSTGTASLGSGSGDLGGFVTLTPGGTGIGTSALAATVTFAAAYAAGPWVLFVPYNQAAIAAMQAGKALNVVSSTTGFTINTGTTALTSGTAYQFQYICVI